MRKVAALAAAALLTGAVATSGLAAKPPKGGTLTVAAAPNPVRAGNAAALTGALSSQAAGVTVTAQAQPYPFSGAFKDVGTAKTTTGGAYALSVTPDALTRYRVTAATSPKTTSPTVDVAVRWRVAFNVSTRTPKRGARVRFSGTVTPVDNASAIVQRHATTGWKTVRLVPLHPNATSTLSTYSVRLRVRHTGRYRVQIAADPSHLSANSRVLRLRVHS